MSRILFVMSAVLLLGPASVLGQLTTATISGTVKDSSGGVLPGVTVTIRNTETGVERTVVTGAEGRYHAPSLPVGNYEVIAELQGFRRAVRLYFLGVLFMGF